MTVVYLGLGSNLENREHNIHKAIRLLSENHIHILKTSALIETDPVDGPAQGKFLNAVLKAETVLTPLKLLSTTQSIEQQMGRIKTVRNGPRLIDIDILLYGNENINQPGLVIPHPRLRQRNFVLNPFREIEPGLVDALLLKEKKAHAHH